jgi:hypothetical protein
LLVDVHPTAVDPKLEVGPRVERLERPESGVAAEVEDSPAPQGAAAERHHKVEEIARALAVGLT